MSSSFIEPCLPSPADRPPSGSNWIHEIKHDGYRLMARRDPVGIGLITRRGNDWTTRFPLIVEAVNHLKVRSCLIDGEAVCCDEKGLAVFHVLRKRRNEAQAFLYAFDLLELNGTDLRREPIEVRKATLASIVRKSRPGVRLNEHLEPPGGRCGVPSRLQDGAGGHRK
jgi:bifunctional non-homologous end joining protein LigD